MLIKIKISLEKKFIYELAYKNIIQLEVNDRESIGWLIYKIEELKHNQQFSTPFQPHEDYFDNISLHHRIPILLGSDGIGYRRNLTQPISNFSLEKEECILQTHYYDSRMALYPFNDEIIRKEYIYFENYAENKTKEIVGFCAFSSINNGYDSKGEKEKNISNLPWPLVAKIGTFFTTEDKVNKIIKDAKTRKVRLEDENTPQAQNTNKRCIPF